MSPYVRAKGCSVLVAAHSRVIRRNLYVVNSAELSSLYVKTSRGYMQPLMTNGVVEKQRTWRDLVLGEIYMRIDVSANTVTVRDIVIAAAKRIGAWK